MERSFLQWKKDERDYTAALVCMFDDWPWFIWSILVMLYERRLYAYSTSVS